MARILIVEDEEYFRTALVQYLTGKKHDVTPAPNGKVARNILSTSDFDVVLSDVQMPFLNGIELLEWLKANKPMPFILMTGFTNLLETKSAFDLGADEFLAKPFKNEELMAAINKLTAPKNAPPEVKEELDRSFCKVSIEEFVSKPQIEFDVYVRLSEKKYVKIGHKGDLFPRDRINAYRDKGIHFLHIRKEDFDKLVGFNLQLMKLIKDSNQVTNEKKVSFIKFTNEVLLERAFMEGVDEQGFRDAKDFLGTTVSLVTESNEAFEILNVLNDHSDFIYAHSLGVALYAIMIARKLEFTSSQLFFKLGMAGMFHDVGKKEIPREILEKPRPLLTQKERALVETHPTRSKEILSVIQGVPSDVIQMVYEHHEDNIGQGYPRAIDKAQLHPLSKILITANHFTEHAIKGPHSPGMPPAAAIKHIESLYMDRLDKACIQALKAVFVKVM